jgi:hypothetical protein
MAVRRPTGVVLLTIDWTDTLIVGRTLLARFLPPPLPCFMATDQTSGCRANQAVMARIVAHGPTGDGTFEAALGVR